MPDKERERFYLAQLRRCVELPAGEPEVPEPPDFVLGSRPFRVGIEMTEYHHPPVIGKRPHQEVQSLRDRIVATAERLHTEAGGPALYVTVIFGHQGKLSKVRVQPIARVLAYAVLCQRLPASVCDPSVEIPHNCLPPEIANVHIHGSLDGKDKLWYASAGGWVARIDPTDVQREIDRKGRIIREARLKCDALWLVIVHHLVRGGPCELTVEARTSVYHHVFDRVLWLDPHRPLATDLISHIESHKREDGKYKAI